MWKFRIIQEKVAVGFVNLAVMYENLRSLQYTRAPLKEIEQALKNRDIKVGELALLALGSILQHPNFPQKYLEKFRTREYSKKIFGLSYPLLVRRRDWQQSMGQYYRENLLCGNEYYWLTSSWNETHRCRLSAWIYLNKIDLDENRKEWRLDEPLSMGATKKRELNSGVVGLERYSHNETWVIDIGRIREKNRGKLRSICIPKKLLELIAKQGRLCVIQARVSGVVKLYAIESSELDKGFWRDVKHYSVDNDNKNWHFCLHPVSGYLYNIKGKRICFARCRISSSLRPMAVEAYNMKKLPSWVKDEPKPVHPILPPLHSSLNEKGAEKEDIKKKKTFDRRSTLSIVLPAENEPRLRVEIPTAELHLTKKDAPRLCEFYTYDKSSKWEIQSDELVNCLHHRHVAPIAYRDRGEVWQFYLAVETRYVYKHSTGGNEILILKRGVVLMNDNEQESPVTNEDQSGCQSEKRVYKSFEEIDLM